MYRTDEAPSRAILVVAGRGMVAGYERATGRQLWTQQFRQKALFGGEVGRSGAMDLELARERVYVAFDGRIVCLDYASGAILGEIVLMAHGRVRMVVDGDQLFVAFGQAVHCYSLDGQLVWKADRMGTTDYHGLALGFPGNIRQGDDLGNE